MMNGNLFYPRTTPGRMSEICLLLVILLFPLPAFSANVFSGQDVFSVHCQACHGGNGVNVHPLAPNFQRGDRLFVSDLMLLESLRNGKGAMPAFSGILREEEMLDAIAYIRTLPR